MKTFRVLKKQIAVYCWVVSLVVVTFPWDPKSAHAAAAEPELPRAYIDTTMPDTTDYTVVNIGAGGDLQAAIDNAACGTVIKLQAGATYGGNFYLRNRGECNGRWIIITSSETNRLPPAGKRVGPSDAGFMPRITTSVYHSDAIFRAENKANHYRFVGLEIASSNPGLDYLQYDMVVIGNTNTMDSPDEYPHHIYFDRTYIHGTPGGTIKRGIALNGNHLAVIDSYISDIHAWGFDSQAICSWDGTGPFKIVNNYLEGAGENVMFGGATGLIPNVVMADIEMRGNHLFKPLRWKADEPTYDGSPWSVKNLFELKKAKRVLVEGNVFENNWPCAQRGTAIVLTPRSNEGDSGTGGVVNDIMFRNNIVKNVYHGVGLSVRDDGDPRVPPGVAQANRIAIVNNIWEVKERAFEQLGTWDNIIDHNTVASDTVSVIIETPMMTQNFQYTNNLALYGYYGIFGSGAGIGTAALDMYMENYLVHNNVFVLNRYNPADYYSSPEYISSRFPSGNLFPISIADVDFTNYNNGMGGDYTLRSSSPYKNLGTDGKDIGADIAAVVFATRGAVTGIWERILSLSPTSQSFGAAGGSGTIQVTALTEGGWRAESNVGWISVTSGANGKGDGQVSYIVSANAGTTPRSGTLIIGGETFAVNEDGMDSILPSTPTGLQAAVISSSQMDLSWAASTDNVAVAGYRIYRNGKQIGTSPSTTYEDTGLRPKTSYRYQVAAYDGAGNLSKKSKAVSKTTQPLPSTKFTMGDRVQVKGKVAIRSMPSSTGTFLGH